MRVLTAVYLALTLTIAIGGCQRSAPPAKTQAVAEATSETKPPPATQDVTMLAAASTQEAIEAAAREFERLNPTVKIHTSFASSSMLAEQIASGASADLFLSANHQWADYLQQKGFVAEQHHLLGNQLVTVLPAEASWTVAKPEDLVNDQIQHIAIGDPDSVPAGIYAKQALVSLQLWDRLKERMAQADDVRHALAMVETGAAEAGIVYSTDAAVSKKVKVAFPFDSKLTEPIVYPLTLTKAGVKNSTAVELYHFLQSSAAATVFRQSGFRVQQKAGVQ